MASILPYPPASGGQLRTLRLIETIERVGATPRLLITAGGSEQASKPLLDRGWEVELFEEDRQGPLARLNQHLARRPIPLVRPIADRIREIVAAGASFVQFENAQNAIYGRAAQGARLALSAHNVDAELIGTQAAALAGARRLRMRLRQHAMSVTERRAARRCDATICVSEHDAAAFRSLGAEQVVVAPNGVDDELFEVSVDGAEPDSLLFFGLLSYEPNAHGIERFLSEGWGELLRRRPRTRLRIAGGGAPESLARLARGTEGVELLGRVPGVPAELARAAVALVPIWQGGGTRLKVLEAMGAARPVVTTSLGASGTGLEHGRHGLIVEEPEALASAAARLLDDPEQARALGRAGRELAERYRWPLALEPARRLYERWLEPDRGRRRRGGA